MTSYLPYVPEGGTISDDDYKDLSAHLQIQWLASQDLLDRWLEDTITRFPTDAMLVSTYGYDRTTNILLPLTVSHSSLSDDTIIFWTSVCDDVYQHFLVKVSDHINEWEVSKGGEDLS